MELANLISYRMGGWTIETDTIFYGSHLSKPMHQNIPLKQKEVLILGLVWVRFAQGIRAEKTWANALNDWWRQYVRAHGCELASSVQKSIESIQAKKSKHQTHEHNTNMISMRKSTNRESNEAKSSKPNKRIHFACTIAKRRMPDVFALLLERCPTCTYTFDATPHADVYVWRGSCSHNSRKHERYKNKTAKRFWRL